MTRLRWRVRSSFFLASLHLGSTRLSRRFRSASLPPSLRLAPCSVGSLAHLRLRLDDHTPSIRFCGLTSCPRMLTPLHSKHQRCSVKLRGDRMSRSVVVGLESPPIARLTRAMRPAGEQRYQERAADRCRRWASPGISRRLNGPCACLPWCVYAEAAVVDGAAETLGRGLSSLLVSIAQQSSTHGRGFKAYADFTSSRVANSNASTSAKTAHTHPKGLADERP